MSAAKMSDVNEKEISELDENERKCELCVQQGKESTALMICRECDEMLCADCGAVHTSQKYARSHHLLEITELSKVREKRDQGKKKCEPCATQNKDVDALMFCQNCEELLCCVCSSVHSSQKVTKGHQQITVDQMKPADVKPCEPCLENGATVEAIKLCKNCEEAMCEKCVNAHRSQKATKGHELIEICDFTPDSKADRTCEPCQESGKDSPAFTVCAECEEFLCTTCAKIHKTQKATRDHKLMDVADIPVILCEPCTEKGNNVPADQKCTECEEAMCVSCIDQHKSQKATKRHHFEKILLNLNDLKFCDPCSEAYKEEVAVKYCEQCDEFYCTSCTKMHGAQKATKKHSLVDPKFAVVKGEDREQVSTSIQEPKTPVQELQKKYEHVPDKQVTSKRDTRPGQPKGSDVKSDSIKLHWEPLSSFKDSNRYQIRYKQKGGKWMFYPEQPERATITISYLQTEATYIFQVRAIIDDDEGPYSQESAEITTKPSLASHLLKFCTKVKDGQPAIYQLHSTENRLARNEKAKTRKFELGEAPIVRQKEKTILLVGATGTGKSTLVDGIINFVTGVTWKDPYRFSLIDLEAEEKNKNQALSQTEWITCYTINQEEGGRLDYRLKIIDTPGFGDTRGLDRDSEIVKQLKELFSAADQKGVVFLDAVCFLTKAPDARLTAIQKYIFMSIQSLFGKDIEKNICMLITFADGKDPPVLAAMKEADLPFSSWYAFNNSALFATNDDSQCGLSSMFWDMGIKSFKKFFDYLEKMPTKSLQQTKQVLNERERLEVTIQKLQPQVDAGLNKVNELKKEKKILKEHEKDILDNQNFRYVVEETRQVKTELPKGQNTTNCLHCHVTCHITCVYANDDQKQHCCAMGWDGNCTVCESKCHWTQHANTPYIFSYETHNVTKTYEEKLKMYQKAGEGKVTHEQVIKRMTEEIEELSDFIEDMMEQVNDCNNTLKSIALRPNPLTMVEHIDLMIEAEKMEKKDGFQERIKVLQNYHKKATIGTTVSMLKKELETTTTTRSNQKKAEIKNKEGFFKRNFNKFFG